MSVCVCVCGGGGGGMVNKSTYLYGSDQSCVCLYQKEIRKSVDCGTNVTI